MQSPCACSDLLSGSRTSRLYSRLVQAGKAYSADAVPYFPGEKHPNAFLLYALPSDALSLAQLQGAVQEQVQGLAASGPSGQELQRIKKVRYAAGLGDAPHLFCQVCSQSLAMFMTALFIQYVQ